MGWIRDRQWILRPAGVCAIGTLVVVCGLSAAGGALAAPEPSMLRPDAPPSGAVVSPTPDQPDADAVRGAMRSELRPPLPLPVRRSAPAEPSHPVARPHAKPRQAAATKPIVLSSPPPRAAAKSDTVVLPRQGRLPDSVRAFLATPITRISDRRARPRDHGPRGHISRDGGPRCRLPDRGSEPSGAGALR